MLIVKFESECILKFYPFSSYVYTEPTTSYADDERIDNASNCILG